jgi:coniferyl-aldehyde dehydrogenase
MSHSLLLNVTDEMTVMQDEIFGPLLPIVPYKDLEQAFAYINQRPRPLALYYFGYDKREQQRVLHETHSGGVCLNDTLLHVAQDDMPFGGIGASGMGQTTVQCGEVDLPAVWQIDSETDPEAVHSLTIITAG